jgi:hypothetical protein
MQSAILNQQLEVAQLEVKGLVIPKRGTIARGMCCGSVEKKQIPRPINLASE